MRLPICCLLLFAAACGAASPGPEFLSVASEGFLFLENVEAVVRSCDTDETRFQSPVSVYRGTRESGESVHFAFLENTSRRSFLEFAEVHGFGVRLADTISIVEGCESSGVPTSSEVAFNSAAAMARVSQECDVQIDIMYPYFLPPNLYVRNDEVVCMVLGSRDAEEVGRLLDSGPGEDCVSQEEYEVFSRQNFKPGCG